MGIIAAVGIICYRLIAPSMGIAISVGIAVSVGIICIEHSSISMGIFTSVGIAVSVGIICLRCTLMSMGIAVTVGIVLSMGIRLTFFMPLRLPKTAVVVMCSMRVMDTGPIYRRSWGSQGI